MSYQTVLEIANNSTLTMRIAACAASEDIPDPQTWASARKWEFASQPGWGATWAYAKDSATVNHNPDIGAREDVIGDAEILAAVQSVKAAEEQQGTA